MEVNYGRGNTPMARMGRQDADRPSTGAPPGTLGAFSYNGAHGAESGDHAEASGICAGSRQPICVGGHLDPRQAIDIEVMNGDLPAPLLAFDEDDEVLVNSHWMACSNKGWPVNRGDREDVVIGNFRAERLVVEYGLAELDCIRLLI